MIVSQTWTHDLTCMQQAVLFAAVRGPDGVGKYHVCKYLLRWYRRCVLLGALDHNVFTDPYDPRGGSFTGPSVNDLVRHEIEHGRLTWTEAMQPVFDNYLKSLDELPHHFQLHFMHAAEIVGYKHPDQLIRSWWNYVYQELANDMHLTPETEEQLDFRLADSEEQWRAKSSKATQS